MKTGEKTESGSKSKSEKGTLKTPFIEAKIKKTAMSDKIRELHNVLQLEPEK